MKLLNTRNIIPLLVVALLMVTAGCSTQKNTAKTRWWHAFKARYNTYYNGTLAYIDGSLEKENGNKDNFTELIPLYTVGNKQSREIGKGNFDKAIEKCQKTIKLHSIKRRPQWTKKRRKTEKDIEWLSRREYNPFLWKAWMLMGRSQFHKGAFDEAASTFSYMSRLYQTQPAIYAKARAWLTKCYVEEGWLYDAEDVIRNMRRDSIHWSARKEWDYAYADYYIHAGDYEQAIPYLRSVIKHEMRRKQRAREWYLMGQMQAALGHNDLAMKAFRKVVAQNPPYEVEFNARIAMTEVMSKNQSKKMIGHLKRMAASDKNKDYLDQVYYAIGNIYLNQKDTTEAIRAYERGNTKATRNGIEKGVLLLKLGDLYWDLGKFGDARRCYGAAIGMLDKDRKDYAQLSRRSTVLDELVPYTDAIHLQDSLQVLAKMDEKDRNAAIDRVIDALKKKEKEERRLQAEQNAQETMAKNGGDMSMNDNNRNNPALNQNNNDSKGGLWYFYNQLAVNQGKTAFQKLWGKRENVDNWQRINKTVVSFGEESELTEEQQDSIMQAEAERDSLEQIADSAQNNPHKREYYLAQIPFTEEQVQASNLIIEDGLYHAGVIFKDKLDNLALSEKHLRRLTDNYPDYQNMADVFYHLFLLYSRKGEPEVAEQYVRKLKEGYPDNAWTILLTDPYFKENSRFGVHIEDSLYASTYEAFKESRYGEVKGNVHLSETRFPLGANRDKFIFIGGLGKLNDGDADGCLADMKMVVEKYPQSGVSEMAGMIVKGVQAGKRLHGGKFDLGNVWDRRTSVLNDNDSTAAKEFSAERNMNFVFMVAYMPDSVNENRLLFELAKYNFSSYLVRNFDIEIENVDGLHRMMVKGFRNYDEALQYARHFHSQLNLAQLIGKSRTIVISEQNLEMLGRQFSYDDYSKFYNKHFAPLKVSTFELLTEPGEITTVKRREEPLSEEDIDRALDNGNYLDTDDEDGTAPGNTTVVTEETPAQGAENGGTEQVPDNAPAADENAAGGATTIVTEPETTEPDEGTTVVPDTPAQQPGEEPTETTVVTEEPTSEEQELPSATMVETPQTVPDNTRTNTETEKENTAAPSTRVEEKRSEKAPSTTVPEQPQRPTQPQPTVEEPQQKPQPSKILEDEFYFDEDVPASSAPQPSTSTKKEEKETGVEYDDEYYDLDGF